MKGGLYKPFLVQGIMVDLCCIFSAKNAGFLGEVRSALLLREYFFEMNPLGFGEAGEKEGWKECLTFFLTFLTRLAFSRRVF